MVSGEDECLKLRLVLYFAIAALEEQGTDISDDFKVGALRLFRPR